MPAKTRLMPEFSRNPREAAAVFRLVAGYGELEFQLAECLGQAVNDPDGALLAIFVGSGVQARIDMTAALSRKFFTSIGFGRHLQRALEAMQWCLTTRNLFAHCHWADWEKDPGLYFVSLYDGAEREATAMAYKWRHTDIALLKEAEAHFLYAKTCLFFLTETARYYREERKAPQSHAQWPEKRDAPMRHNPPEKHIPPWPTSIRKAPRSEPSEKRKSEHFGWTNARSAEKQRRLLSELREWRRRAAKK